eukprot:UN27704
MRVEECADLCFHTDFCVAFDWKSDGCNLNAGCDVLADNGWLSCRKSQPSDTTVQEMEKEVSELPLPPGFYPDQQSCYDCQHLDACNCGVCGSFGGCSVTCEPGNSMFDTQPGGEKCTKQWCKYCPASQPDRCNCGVCGSFGNCGVSCFGGRQGFLEDDKNDREPVDVDWFKSISKPVGIPCVICWEELPIEGSEDWWTCQHSNTYTCNGGDSCCCDSGWQPGSDGSCSDRCDANEELSANTYDALNAPLHSGAMYFL